MTFPIRRAPSAVRCFNKMGDMFKPGIFISLIWVVVMTAVMLLIAKPIGLM